MIHHQNKIKYYEYILLSPSKSLLKHISKLLSSPKKTMNENKFFFCKEIETLKNN
jgi:hypothetical protein